jgi:GT2 family glycosyltransferase
MFNISTPHTNYSERKSGTELPLHVTCGCVYRREALARVGGFSKILHSGAEETDLSLRLIHEGYKIRFYSEKVFHNFAPEERSKEWYLKVRHNTTRNDLAIVYMRYPFPIFIIHLAGKAFGHLRFSIANGRYVLSTLLVTCKAIFSFFVMLPKLQRKPVTNSELKYWLSLRGA